MVDGVVSPAVSVTFGPFSGSGGMGSCLSLQAVVTQAINPQKESILKKTRILVNLFFCRTHDSGLLLRLRCSAVPGAPPPPPRWRPRLAVVALFKNRLFRAEMQGHNTFFYPLFMRLGKKSAIRHRKGCIKSSVRVVVWLVKGGQNRTGMACPVSPPAHPLPLGDQASHRTGGIGEGFSASGGGRFAVAAREDLYALTDYGPEKKQLSLSTVACESDLSFRSVYLPFGKNESYLYLQQPFN